VAAFQMGPLQRNALTRRTTPNKPPPLGPSGSKQRDHLGMAGGRARVEPWQHMPNTSVHRRDLVRALAVVLAVVALIATSSAFNWVTPASAATRNDPKKAVVVSGPVHGLTSRYKGYAKAIADAAEAQGMDVKRVFHPYASKSRVKRMAQGADLFVYVGHGNGWPSSYGPFQEDTKNGLGLDPDDPKKRGPNTVVYKGANWLRANIELAPNAVVILSHLSYASGNASSGMAIPSRSVAVQRVDNFANGFLSIGAQVVWALGWQPGADIVKALHQENATMDAVFMTRYRSNVSPLNGWIGQNPGYFASERIPGATVHIDPHSQYGYLRGITGNLEFTTTQWRDAEALPPDTTPPSISDVRASQAAVTLATADSELPVFTPNGDGISDSIKIRHNLSENAFVELRIKHDGNIILQRSTWSLKGDGSIAWNGRRDDGEFVGEGMFKIILTPTDRAGNKGEPADVKVRVLNSMRKPTVNPQLFHPDDADDLGQTSALKAKLSRPATASWLIRNSKGEMVRRAIDAVDYEPGDVRFVWDGKNDEGAYVPEGRYTARIKVNRPLGTYAHEVTLFVMPFKMRSPTWKLKRGQVVSLTFDTAEPMKGKPVITAKQPGISKYALKVTKLSPTKFKAKLATRKGGKAGELRIRINGLDQSGGNQWQLFTLRVR
jgi:flagellar hook assembly protein FlgD